jgi:hypothetical protein
MPANYDELQAALTSAVQTATELQTVADSAVAILDGAEAEIIARLEADNKLDQASTDAAVANVKSVMATFTAAKEKLAAAIVAHTPAANPGT